MARRPRSHSPHGKRNAGSKDVPVNQRCLMFVTNLSHPSVAGLLAELPGEYMKRQGRDIVPLCQEGTPYDYEQEPLRQARLLFLLPYHVQRVDNVKVPNALGLPLRRQTAHPDRLRDLLYPDHHAARSGQAFVCPKGTFSPTKKINSSSKIF